MAYTASATGWTWDYVEWHLDIPRLVALNAHWRRFPPPVVQLARIASMVGALLGIDSKPQPEQNRIEPASDEQNASLLGAFPLQPAQRYITAQEYLAARNTSNGVNDGH